MKNRVYYRFADGSRVSMDERKGEREILVFAEDWPNAAVERKPVNEARIKPAIARTIVRNGLAQRLAVVCVFMGSFLGSFVSARGDLMGLKCGLFPVSLTWAPGMALLEDTYGKRLAPYGASFLQRVAPNEFFQDSGQATTLQKQRDCGLRCWVGSAARGGPRRGWGDAAPRARRRGEG